MSITAIKHLGKSVNRELFTHCTPIHVGGIPNIFNEVTQSHKRDKRSHRLTCTILAEKIFCGGPKHFKMLGNTQDPK